eukprot:jgi/Botrbrau1/5755/Bobra.0134s0027.1
MEKPRRKVSKPPRHSSPSDLALMEAEIALKAAEESVRQVEKTIWSSETRLLEKQNVHANAFSGYDGLLTGKEHAARKEPVRTEERIFSGSSVSGTHKS